MWKGENIDKSVFLGSQRSCMLLTRSKDCLATLIQTAHRRWRWSKPRINSPMKRRLTSCNHDIKPSLDSILDKCIIHQPLGLKVLNSPYHNWTIQNHLTHTHNTWNPRKYPSRSQSVRSSAAAWRYSSRPWGNFDWNSPWTSQLRPKTATDMPVATSHTIQSSKFSLPTRILIWEK